MTSKRTTAPVVVYDGTCGFCTWSVIRLRKRLPATVDVQPYQLLDLEANGLTLPEVRTAAYWLGADGSRLRGHRTFAAWLRASGGGWAVAGRVLDLPPVSWLAALFYLIISRNRHRIPGPWEKTCEVPPRG